MVPPLKTMDIPQGTCVHFLSGLLILLHMEETVGVYARPRLGIFTRRLIVLIVIGIAIRLVLSVLCTFSFDMSFWTGTAEGLDGGRGIYDATYYSYPPLWGYIIGVMGGVGNLLGVSEYGHLFSELISPDSLSTVPSTVVTTIEAGILFKFPLLVADIFTAFVLYYLTHHLTNDRKRSELSFALWFLCPLVIWSSSIAVMFDSISALFMLLGVYFLIKEKYMLSGPAFVLAVSTKVFPVCLLFVVIGYILSKNRGNRELLLKNTLGFFVCGILTALVIYLPVIMAGDLSTSMEFLTGRYSEFSEGTTVVGILQAISYSQIIIFAPFIMLILFILGVYVYRSDGDKERSLVTASILVFTAMFTWPPTPTYPIVMIPFLILAISVYSEKNMMICLVLFSVIMTAAAIAIFNIRIFYSVAAYTDLLDLGNMVSIYNNNQFLFSKIYGFLKVMEFIPGISVIILFMHKYLNQRKGGQIVA